MWEPGSGAHVHQSSSVMFFFFFLLFALRPSALCLPLRHPSTSSTHVSSCLLLGEITLMLRALMTKIHRSSILALPLLLFPSLHWCLLAPTPTGVWQASCLIPSLLVSVSLNTQQEDQGGKEWWMAVPQAFSLPFPDRSPLIAFPGLSFAGNGLKHDMSLTRCLPRERKGVP